VAWRALGVPALLGRGKEVVLCIQLRKFENDKGNIAIGLEAKCTYTLSTLLATKRE